VAVRSIAWLDAVDSISPSVFECDAAGSAKLLQLHDRGSGPDEREPLEDETAGIPNDFCATWECPHSIFEIFERFNSFAGQFKDPGLRAFV
jgi:hypothetical protein